MTFWNNIIGRLGASADAPTDSSRGVVAGNPLALLPKESAEKLERLNDERAAARAVLRSKTDALMELQEQHSRAQSEMQRALPNLPAPRGTTTEEMVARIEADGNRHKAALDRAIAAQQRAGEAARAHDYLSDVEAWLTRYASLGGRLEHAPLPKPTLGVPTIRAKLADIDRAWSEAENAPAPRDDYKARALAEVNALADAGRLAIDMRNRGPNPLNLRSRLAPTLDRLALPPLQAGGPPDVHYFLSGADECAALLAWLHRDALIERISKEIDNADDVGALSHEAREARFKKLAEQRLALNFAEEAAIVAAAKAGQGIARRRDADPRAVLEVREV